MAMDWTQRMREDWNARAIEDWKYHIIDDPSMSEDDFFRSGQAYASDLTRQYLGIPLDPSWRVLDVGCGVGRVTFAFAQACREAIGIDIAPDMIARANRFESEKFRTGRARFVVGSGVDLAPIATGSIDYVWCGLVLGHVPAVEVMAGYLAEFDRVLRPGGHCVAMTQDFGPRDESNPTGLGARFGASELFEVLLERKLSLSPLRMSSFGHLGFWFGMRKHPEGRSAAQLEELAAAAARALREREEKLREYLWADPDRSIYGDYVKLRGDGERRERLLRQFAREFVPGFLRRPLGRLRRRLSRGEKLAH